MTSAVVVIVNSDVCSGISGARLFSLGCSSSCGDDVVGCNFLCLERMNTRMFASAVVVLLSYMRAAKLDSA